MNTLNIIVTTGLKPSHALQLKGRRAAEALGAPFVPRENLSLDALRKVHRASVILLVTRKGLIANTPEGELYFHLNMAHLRIKNIRMGSTDHMAEAMGLRAGMSVLDCTLGLASDAIVSSYIAGDTGRVTGVEVNPLTAYIVREGLRAFPAEHGLVKAALERIEVVCAAYESFLEKQAADSFDVVYMDPMFRRPIRESVHLKPMRYVADHRPIALSAILQAKRVAKRRVVVKEASGSGEFARLGISRIVGGKYSSVQYGVIDLDET